MENLFGKYIVFELELRKYTNFLLQEADKRGLLGPREKNNIWNRHILNSVVCEEMIPLKSLVFDVGSGAGLPGIPLAIVRKDLTICLIEPLPRRAIFLREAVALLGLTNRVIVVQKKVEELQVFDLLEQVQNDFTGFGRFLFSRMILLKEKKRTKKTDKKKGVADIVIVRALASLKKLIPMCVEAVKPGGSLLAIKGKNVYVEIEELGTEFDGFELPQVCKCGIDFLETPTTVVDFKKK